MGGGGGRGLGLGSARDAGRLGALPDQTLPSPLPSPIPPLPSTPRRRLRPPLSALSTRWAPSAAPHLDRIRVAFAPSRSALLAGRHRVIAAAGPAAALESRSPAQARGRAPPPTAPLPSCRRPFLAAHAPPSRSRRPVLRRASRQGAYRGVFPVKCNHDKDLIRAIVKAGAPYGFGLEVCGRGGGGGAQCSRSIGGGGGGGIVSGRYGGAPQNRSDHAFISTHIHIHIDININIHVARALGLPPNRWAPRRSLPW
jgi:hypothetical protein